MPRSRRRPASRSSTNALLCPLDGFARGRSRVRRRRRERLQRDDAVQVRGLRAGREDDARERASPRACNTLRFDADGWLGDNTDGAGLVRDIERNAGVDLRGARVLLIGAGGGAAGALGPLLGERRERGRRRQPQRRQARARSSSAIVEALGAADVGARRRRAARRLRRGLRRRRQRDATSVAGAAGAGRGRACCGRGGLALDMMYGPAAAGFVAWAEAHGAIGRDGLGMLVEQAAEAFCSGAASRPTPRRCCARCASGSRRRDAASRWRDDIARPQLRRWRCSSSSALRRAAALLPRPDRDDGDRRSAVDDVPALGGVAPRPRARATTPGASSGSTTRRSRPTSSAP